MEPGVTKDIKEEKVQYEFSLDVQKTKVTFVLSCEEICFNNDRKKEYQTFVYLPFLTKSSKTSSSYENKLEDRAKKTIESALRTKYKEIMKRDYNHWKKFTRFKELVGEKLGNDNEKIKRKYSTLYHHDANEKIDGLPIGDIWNQLAEVKKIEKLSDLYKEIKLKNSEYKFDLSWEKFVSILINGKCSYCGLTILHIYDLAEKEKFFTKRFRGYSMEVDQIDAYGSYTDDNCAASCYWCNNAKTDEFRIHEFKEIARGIHKTWKERGAKIEDFDILEFWKNINPSTKK